MLLATRSRSALRSSLRYIHTTARTCDETNPSQSQPSRLGFGDYTGRTRVLPAIPISPSSKRNVLKSRFPGSSPALNQQTSPRTRGEGRRPQEKQRRQARSPVQASIRQLEAQEQSSVEGEEEFFVGNDDKAASRSKGAGLKSVDMDFAAPSPVKSSSARGRRATSSKERTVREKRPRAPRPVEPEVEDRSPEGIFGRASLLFPVRRGAREAERSVWAENLQPAEARKAEIGRLAGSPAVYLPDKPLPTELTGKNAAQASRMLSTWLLSTNSGVSMRRAKGGDAIINSYLK